MSFVKSTYRRVLKRIPPPVAVRVQEAIDATRGRPRVYVDPADHARRTLERGSVTFSIDFELAWAWRYTKSGRNPLAMAALEREQVPKLVRIFEEYEIPVTWATVGHLFLDRCSRGAHGLAHEDLPRVPHFESTWWKFGTGDWYQHDPCTDRIRDPAWYGPELVETVMRSTIRHEIACHTFSHTGFASYCPADVAAAELDACLDAMKSFGLTPKTLVFPGNDAGHFGIVAKKGFRTIRWFPDPDIAVALPVRMPEGLWAQHASLCMEAGTEPMRLRMVQSLLRRILRKAVRTRKNAHFWFHPSIPDIDIENLLLPTLKAVASLREKGKLDVFTMDDLSGAMEQGMRNTMAADSRKAEV